MSCDVGEVTERLENELCYITTHSPTLPSLYLRHRSFSNPSVASPTSQLILQPFFRFSYVTSSSHNTHGEPPMERTIMAGEHTWYLQDPYTNYASGHVTEWGVASRQYIASRSLCSSCTFVSTQGRTQRYRKCGSIFKRER